MEWILLALAIGFVLGFFSGKYLETKRYESKLEGIRKQHILDMESMLRGLDEPSGI